MRRVSLARVTRMFGWIGLSSIGGGRSAYLYEMLVDRHRWLTPEEFLPGYTLCQLLPGPTISNLAVFLGNGLRGWPGALVALLAVLGPGSVAIVALATWYFGYGPTPQVAAVLRGMGAAVVGFMAVMVGRMGRGALRSRAALLWGGLTFVAVGLLHVNTFSVILTVGAGSLWTNRPKHAGPADTPRPAHG